MEILKSFSIAFLLSIITLIQHNDCSVEKFPPNFSRFSTKSGTKYNFTGGTKYAKIFCIEQLLLELKKAYDNPGSSSAQKINVTDITSEFRKLGEDIKAHFDYLGRRGRGLINFRVVVNFMCGKLDMPTMDDLDSLISDAYDEVIDDIVFYDNMASEAISDAISDAFRSSSNSDRSIFPGTLWCGAGNTASSDDELGVLRKEDNCCRQHDKCPFNIEANKKFGHLVNKGLFTKSACFCDREFYECLKKANTIIADKIGFVYFTLLSPQCIGYDYPITGCKRNGRLDYVHKKCFVPSVDIQRTPQLQWFNNPDY